MTRRQAFSFLFFILVPSLFPVGATVASEAAAPSPGGVGGSEARVPESPALPAPPATDELINGMVRNGLGTAMDRALVLLTPLGGAGSVRTALTDASGRYQFAGVGAGTYRITAIREGYEASIGNLSTWMVRRLDLVLVPAGDAGLVAPRPDWVLTAPARDMLRETEASSDLPGGALAPAPASIEVDREPAMSRTSEILQSVDGEIRQSFLQADAASIGSPGTPSGGDGGSGNATSLLVGSPIGNRLRWDFLGERLKENTSWRDAGIEARQASAERVRVNIRYDTGDTGRLDMRAYYDHDALDFEPLVSGDPSYTNSERRGWGYDAGWSSALDNDSSLQVEMKYLGSAVGGTRGSKAGRDDGQYVDGEAANANVWRTSARYSKNVGSGHGVHIGVKARVYSFGGDDTRRVAPTPQQDPSLFEEYGRNGWTVSVSAADSWRMLDPVAFDYGFDVSRSAYSARSIRQAMVPQAGVTLTPGSSTIIRGAVSYVAFERELVGPGVVEEPVVARDQSSALGYRLRLEHRLGSSLLVILDGESRPCLYDSIGASWDSPGTTDNARNLYVTDPASSVREGHVGFEVRPAEGILFAVGAAAGRVDGKVGASIPYQEMVRTLPDGRVRYGLAHIDGQFDRTRTVISFEMTRLEQSSAGGLSDPYGDRRLLIQLLQGLSFLHPGNTDWSLVLAYDAFRPDSDNSLSNEPDPALHSEMERISGGVSVKF